jgi:hypothetical protein
MTNLNKSTTALAATVLLFSSSFLKAATYSIDDGIYVSAVGIGNSSLGLMLNSFQSVPDSEYITSLDIAFGPAMPVSSAFEIILFSDPDNNGNPSDSLQLGRAAAVSPATIVPGSFVTFTFNTPIYVPAGQRFFAGAVEGPSYTLAIGLDAAGGSSSWATWPGDNPGTATNIATLASFGNSFAKDAMIRANATAVPEPTATVLLFFGAALAAGKRRRI